VPFKDPEARRAYQRQRAQLRRAGKADLPAKVSLPAPLRIQTAREVLALLEEQLNALRTDAALGTVERARSIGALAGVSLRAIEVAGLEDRVLALEKVLTQRRNRR
jgi:hypothetical protein